MRRPLLALLVAIAGLGLLAAGLAWVLDTPRPHPGASRAERVFLGLCAECHGADGRGSWRATLFLIRPGDLTDPSQMRGDSDEFLASIIKNGGAPIGRPGMPAFGTALSDEEIRELVTYIRALVRAR
jgi:mono/diheme cytochrome c family protein